MASTGNAADWNLPFSGYKIANGDTISWRQLQLGGARGGIGIRFTDGTYSNWVTLDTSRQVMNDDTRSGAWYSRTVDLSPFVNLTVAALWINADVHTPAGTWDSYFADIAVEGADGTVLPIYTGQTSIGLGYFGTAGATGTWGAVVQISNVSSPSWAPGDVIFYHGDQIGSARVLTAPGGWPVASDVYYPFGAEPTAPSDSNHYKFTGKERDAESGLDYFGARYYGSNMGRFISPDTPFVDQDPANPQSLNLYSYVRNTPLTAIDPTGQAGCNQTGGLNDTNSCNYLQFYGAAGDGHRTITVPGDSVTVIGNPYPPTALELSYFQLMLDTSNSGRLLPQTAPNNSLMFAQGKGERNYTAKPDKPLKGVRPVVKGGKIVGWTIPSPDGKRTSKSLDWGRANGLSENDPKWAMMGLAAGAAAGAAMEGAAAGLTWWEILLGAAVAF